MNPKLRSASHFAVGLLFCLVLVAYFVFRSQSQNGLEPLIVDAKVLVKQEKGNVGVPLRLKIPTITVDAAIEQVGLTSSGAMDTPKAPNNVAWFTLGQRPGDKGSAVIDGHYGTWKNGQGSVFDNLYQLRKGDRVYVHDDQGVVTTFVVRTIRSYDPKEDASDVFGSSDGKAHLNLITCEGVWSAFSKSYSQRLVVFTDKE